MKILLVAEEAAGIQTLRLLLKSDHELAGVLTNSINNKVSKIASVAQAFDIEVLPARLVRDPDFASWITAHKIEVLLNVHSLYMICNEVIHALPMGAYNLHPGSLPAYAGLNAPSWSIYNEETEHSVTLHQITEGIDEGEIISEAGFALSPEDTGLSVSLKCVQRGLILIEQFLEDLKKKSPPLTGRIQDLSQRTYYRKNQVPWNGKIKWSAPSQKIDAFVRACNYSPFTSPWGVPRTFFENVGISIFRTEISGETANERPGTIGTPFNSKIPIATGDRWILVSRCLINGKFVDASTVLKPGKILR